MKLQKLAYFAHGWNLAIRNTPLINESVEAWKFGPVIPSLYHDVKGYGMEPITAKIPVFRHTGLFRKHYYPAVGDKGDPNQEVRELIHRVWDE